MTTSVAAGWFPDASLPGHERWWDGHSWTATTRPAGAGVDALQTNGEAHAVVEETAAEQAVTEVTDVTTSTQDDVTTSTQDDVGQLAGAHGVVGIDSPASDHDLVERADTVAVFDTVDGEAAIDVAGGVTSEAQTSSEAASQLTAARSDGFNADSWQRESSNVDRPIAPESTDDSFRWVAAEGVDSSVGDNETLIASRDGSPDFDASPFDRPSQPSAVTGQEDPSAAPEVPHRYEGRDDSATVLGAAVVTGAAATTGWAASRSNRATDDDDLDRGGPGSSEPLGAASAEHEMHETQIEHKAVPDADGAQTPVHPVPSEPSSAGEGWSQPNAQPVNAGESNPGYSNPGYSNPGYSNPGYSSPGYSDPGYANPVQAGPPQQVGADQGYVAASPPPGDQSPLAQAPQGNPSVAGTPYSVPPVNTQSPVPPMGAPYSVPPPGAQYPAPPYGVEPYAAGQGAYPGAPYHVPPSGYGVGAVDPSGAELANVWARLGARVIDSFVMAPLFFLLGGPFIASILATMVEMIDYLDTLDSTANPDMSPYASALAGPAVGLMVVAGLVPALYYIIGTGWKGTTVGKYALGMRVAQADSGAKPTWGQSILRWIVSDIPTYFFFFLWLIDPLWCLWDQRRRCVHDLAAKTVVVRR